MDEAIRNAAETALRERLQEPVSLKVTEALVHHVNARNHVCRAALDGPGQVEESTVILKWATPATGLLLREWATLDFISGFATLQEHVPKIYCVNSDVEVAVMEDLGDPNEGLLGKILMGRDRSTAIEALVAFNRKLAEIHAHTAGTQAEWRTLVSSVPPVEKSDRTIDKLGDMLQIFIEFSRTLGQRPSSELAAEIERIKGSLAEPGPFLTLTHGDATPANFFFVKGRSRIFDWEAADFRNCLLDGVFAQVRYLHSVWARRIPDDVREAVQQVYREALIRQIPAAEDDRVYGPHAAACTLTWLAGVLAMFHHALNADARWGRSTIRQRMYTGLIHVNQLPEIAKYFPALAGHVAELRGYFETRWPEEERTLPLYPAFEDT